MNAVLDVKYPISRLVAEGKTKIIHEVSSNPSLVVITSKDDITAGDGAKHDILKGKGDLANQTTCNVFRLLHAHGIDVAFVEQVSSNSFVAPACKMLPYEVVVRREAYGSYLKRNPGVEKGEVFTPLLVEYFLKTKDKNWKGKPLVCDDPLMLSFVSGEIQLFDPSKPISGQLPFLVLADSEVFGYAEEGEIFPEMKRMAAKTFLVLEKAWHLEGCKLVDFKVEFGFDSEDKLLLADVIDSDSWRVLEDGHHIDKQVYRDGGALDEVLAKYKHAAEMTGRF